MDLNQKVDTLLQSVLALGGILEERAAAEQRNVQINSEKIAQLSQVLNEMREASALATMSPQQMAIQIASQIQTLFTNKVMLDQVAMALLSAQLNALSHKAATSKERTPQLVVLDKYVAGAQRAILRHDGSLSMEQQLATASSPDTDWVACDEILGNPETVAMFQELMASHGCDGDKPYFIIDDITLQQRREDINGKLADNTAHIQREAAIRDGRAPLDPAPGQQSGGTVEFAEFAEPGDAAVAETAAEAPKPSLADIMNTVRGLQQ